MRCKRFVSGVMTESAKHFYVAVSWNGSEVQYFTVDLTRSHFHICYFCSARFRRTILISSRKQPPLFQPGIIIEKTRTLKNRRRKKSIFRGVGWMRKVHSAAACRVELKSKPLIRDDNTELFRAEVSSQISNSLSQRYGCRLHARNTSNCAPNSVKLIFWLHRIAMCVTHFYFAQLNTGGTYLTHNNREKTIFGSRLNKNTPRS